MDLMELGAQLLSETMGLQGDNSNVIGALTKLLGDGQGNIDLAGLASKMAANGNLGNIVSSWLGDGANSSISAQDILGLLGEGNVADFASSLGADTGTAAQGLSQVLPEIMDKASSGGNILESLGGAGGLLSAAKSLLG